VAAKPGIFTYDAVGGGQAKAINEDGSGNGNGSINSSHTAAAPGSIVQIFATGLGAVDPAVTQGTPAPSSPLSTVVLPVSATIDGQPATVLFAGAAPGLIGAYQVNVMIPAETRSGAARLVISADGNNSQDGVTIQVR
jgi:adhesin/invasin